MEAVVKSVQHKRMMRSSLFINDDNDIFGESTNFLVDLEGSNDK